MAYQDNLESSGTLQLNASFNNDNIEEFIIALREANEYVSGLSQKNQQVYKTLTSTNTAFRTMLTNLTTGHKSADLIVQDFTKMLNAASQGKLSTSEWLKLMNSLRTKTPAIENSIININRALQSSLKDLHQVDTLASEFQKTLFNSAKWFVATNAVAQISNGLSKAVSYVNQLDTSLNNIKIVTKQSTNEIQNFNKYASSAAQKLATSTNDFTKASLIYYQQGLSDAEAKRRAEITIKTANVTKQAVQEVSEQLTSLWNGYNVAADMTEKYVDKLAAVAANSASNLQELSTAISKVASTANTMGVNIDQLTAQMSTIISVTRQAPESVGTALRTIYARMADLKTDGTDEFGVSLGTVSSQLQDVGINILDTSGNLRDLGTVIEETSTKWNKWTQAQKQAVAIAIAGKR